jgi:hypothetical protein
MSAPVVIVTDRETLQQIIEEVVSRLIPSTHDSQHIRWLNPQEAGEYLGHHNNKEIIVLCKLGKLKHFRKGSKGKSRYMISTKALDTYSLRLIEGERHDSSERKSNRNKRIR